VAAERERLEADALIVGAGPAGLASARREPPRQDTPASSETVVNSRKRNEAVEFHDYKIVLYRQQDNAWVAEIPAISGCYALMPTREEALAELTKVFGMIAEEYREKGQPLPADSTEIMHAQRQST
jgi:predicted RNase H-like HicB family nuclease